MSHVAIDCEMVGSLNGSLLAKVSIVDLTGSILLNEYVMPTTTVIDYRTRIHGITEKHLDNAKSFNDVRSRVSSLISGKVLVGHSLQFDLDALKLTHPEYNRRDLATYGPYKQNDQPRSLKDLAKVYLGEDIQQEVHDSVEDARISMRLYRQIKSW